MQLDLESIVILRCIMFITIAIDYRDYVCVSSSIIYAIADLASLIGAPPWPEV